MPSTLAQAPATGEVLRAAGYDDEQIEALLPGVLAERIAAGDGGLLLNEVLAAAAATPCRPELRLQRAERDPAVRAGIGPVAAAPAGSRWTRSACRTTPPSGGVHISSSSGGHWPRYASLGLGTEITETDIATQSGTGSEARKASNQAISYRNAATACWDIAACTSLTTWGVSDAVTWLGSDQTPLLFDADFRPKPAFDAVRAALQRPRP